MLFGLSLLEHKYNLLLIKLQYIYNNFIENIYTFIYETIKFIDILIRKNLLSKKVFSY